MIYLNYRYVFENQQKSVLSMKLWADQQTEWLCVGKLLKKCAEHLYWLKTEEECFFLTKHLKSSQIESLLYLFLNHNVRFKKLSTHSIMTHQPLMPHDFVEQPLCAGISGIFWIKVSGACESFSCEILLLFRQTEA